MPEARPAREFDRHVGSYDEDLNEGLRVSGERKEFFAERRIEWLAECCREAGVQPRTVLDYGCGTGSSSDQLFRFLTPEVLIGLDESAECLEVARRVPDAARRYLTPAEYVPDGSVDVVYTNGVFHHIPRVERPVSVEFMKACLRPGGLVAFWENNPLNPGTRYVMSRIPFDKDAVTLRGSEARSLLDSAGFDIVHTTYHFVFPRVLKFLRGLERPLMRVPLGAQFQVLARKR